jgi:hypothetical protein
MRPDRDRARINIHEDYEVRYWTKDLGGTPEKLKQTVEKVGVIGIIQISTTSSIWRVMRRRNAQRAVPAATKGSPHKNT